MRATGILLSLLSFGLALCLVQVVATGCGSRAETAVATADSTWIYPAKTPDGSDGLNAKITLCRKISKRSGKPLGAGTVFTIKPKAKVRALVEFDNLLALGDRPLQFHLVWLGPTSKEFYTKRIDYEPDNDNPSIRGSVSIPPERRDPGPYQLRVYLFRELIAQKNFELRASTD